MNSHLDSQTVLKKEVFIASCVAVNSQTPPKRNQKLKSILFKARLSESFSETQNFHGLR